VEELQAELTKKLEENSASTTALASTQLALNEAELRVASLNDRVGNMEREAHGRATALLAAEAKVREVELALAAEQTQAAHALTAARSEAEAVRAAMAQELASRHKQILQCAVELVAGAIWLADF
jgi:hypothetical protein